MPNQVTLRNKNSHIHKINKISIYMMHVPNHPLILDMLLLEF